jgi:hypothetical protein
MPLNLPKSSKGSSIHGESGNSGTGRSNHSLNMTAMGSISPSALKIEQSIGTPVQSPGNKHENEEEKSIKELSLGRVKK